MAPIRINKLSLCNQPPIHRRYTRTSTILSFPDRRGHSLILPSPSNTPMRFYLISRLERVIKTIRRPRDTKHLTFRVSNTSLRSLTTNINNSWYRTIPLHIHSRTNTTLVQIPPTTLIAKAMAPGTTLTGPRIRCGKALATSMDLLSRLEAKHHLLEQCRQVPLMHHHHQAQVSSCSLYSVSRNKALISLALQTLVDIVRTPASEVRCHEDPQGNPNSLATHFGSATFPPAPKSPTSRIISPEMLLRRLRASSSYPRATAHS